jgi:hypothetical protein
MHDDQHTEIGAHAHQDEPILHNRMVWIGYQEGMWVGEHSLRLIERNAMFGGI